MKNLFATLILVLCVLAAWHLGLRASVPEGHMADWLMGAFCLLWLLVVLKVPWDLFFQANHVIFELQRSEERQVPVVPGREAYVRRLRIWLGVLAVGAHLLSAALIATVAWLCGGVGVGYGFAVFYVVSTAFRPAAAGYRYLHEKLRAIGDEVKYPREDVLELRERVKTDEQRLEQIEGALKDVREHMADEHRERGDELRELRQDVHAITREFEVTMSRLTDNQEVIKGIQAFVRLVTHSAHA